MRDADVRFHQEWLGLAQPVEGLVFSVPALADAQIAPKIRPGLTAELETHLENTDAGPALRDVRSFFESFLGYAQAGMLVGRDELSQEISFYAKEGRQEIRPSFAIARGPFEEAQEDAFAHFKEAPDPPESESTDGRSPYIALVWDLSTDAGASGLSIDLDKNETETGPWSYPPTAKLERVLRHTGIPIGLVSNGLELRVVYAPPGESSAHLTFRFKDLAERAGRPLVAALELLFHAERTYGAAPEFTFEGLLRDSRLRQADVTKDLAAQVFEAVEILLEGFEHAAARDCVGDRPNWLREALEEPGDHFYQGILSVVLRLVFILYAEDQSLLPVHRPTYGQHLSVLGLFERLSDDAGSHPESMHLRFGAYGRLIALFRVVFLGVQREDLQLPPRRGKLFDPSAFPFLEGGLPGWTAAILLPEERAAVQLPSIDDNTIYRVLHRLVVFKGQRLSYRSLDVEQIGSVYESLMGYHVLRLESPAFRLGKERVWAETEVVHAMTPTDRKRFWKAICGLSPGAVKKIEGAVKEASDPVSLAKALGELAPGGKSKKTRHRAAAGRLVLQPGEERRRTGSHYTPRWLSEKVVKRTLEPILACLGEDRTAEQILSLKICDPAMGSGAFLVASCRLLAEEVLKAWDRVGETAALTEEHGDALLHARRLVAQRCLYGVDKNAAAVELAKLSLWLVTLSKELPFTFVDHALRHGDSLVGLDPEQIRSFHWEPKEQLETCSRALDDALEQALDHRDQILALADKEDATSQREKQRLLEYSELATARIRMIADVCVGAYFAKDKSKAREKERNEKLKLLLELLNGDESVRERVEAMAADIRARVAPFHWTIEFPEVFYLERPDPLDGDKANRAAMIDAFAMNPPFLGQKYIEKELGASYRDWLFARTARSHGRCDLAAHFLRLTDSLLGKHGTIGMIATNTIAQGDTRTSGLGDLVRCGSKIYDVTEGLSWPGEAAVTISTLNVAKGRPADLAQPVFNGAVTKMINSMLLPRPEREEPRPLAANAAINFNGINTGGSGFVLTADERNELVRSRTVYEAMLPMFLGGEDVNNHPRQESSRYVIDFGEADLGEAEKYPELISIVRERVKPHRDRAPDNAHGRRLKATWWQFRERQPALTRALAERKRCLACAVYTKHLSYTLVPTAGRMFNNKLSVFLLDGFSSFAVLQSRVHEAWARLLSPTMGAADTLSYAPSKCFSTFPFPLADPQTAIESLEIVGKTVYQKRASYMVDTAQGLTATYNALKNPDKGDLLVGELRELHEAMDRAVLDAYGWSDIGVPPFCPRTNDDRAALQEFGDEVIDRLYVLNAERAQEEQRLGAKARTRKSRKTESADAAARAEDKQEELF